MITTYYFLTIILLIILIVINYFMSNNTRQILFVCFFSVISCLVWYYSYNGLTGHPRDIKLEYLFSKGKKFVLKDFHLNPKVEIVIWVVKEDNTVLTFSLPWDADIAEQLYKAKEHEKRTGEQFLVDVDKLVEGVGEEGSGGNGKGTRSETENDTDSSEGMSYFYIMKDKELYIKN